MKKYLNLIVILISLATLVSGLTQLIRPAFILGIVGAEITTTSAHFFAIVGMFMTIFGLLMLHVVYSPQTNSAAIFWCAVQKLGASLAVGWGIANGIFAWPAAGVALFDLFSGFLFLYYLNYLKKNESN